MMEFILTKLPDGEKSQECDSVVIIINSSYKVPIYTK